MEVILLEKVANLGGIGDKVKVKPGYGRNFLLPKNLAILATRETLPAQCRASASHPLSAMIARTKPAFALAPLRPVAPIASPSCAIGPMTR